MLSSSPFCLFSFSDITRAPPKSSSQLSLFLPKLLVTLLQLSPTSHVTHLRYSKNFAFLSILQKKKKGQKKRKSATSPFHSLHFMETEQQGQVCHIDLCISLCSVLLTVEVRLCARGVPLSVCASRRSAVKQIRPTAARWPSRSRPTVGPHKSFCSEIFPSLVARGSSLSAIYNLRTVKTNRLLKKNLKKKKEDIAVCVNLTQK